jgi:hypothetical protein
MTLIEVKKMIQLMMKTVEIVTKKRSCQMSKLIQKDEQPEKENL